MCHLWANMQEKFLQKNCEGRLGMVKIQDKGERRKMVKRNILYSTVWLFPYVLCSIKKRMPRGKRI